MIEITHHILCMTDIVRLSNNLLYGIVMIYVFTIEI